ncbi:helix-turn-helix domain-containing protein [Pseudoalteromonas sp. MMG006]|uniref:AraC family transcriptional regulator n=1 Tax=Pseudoalteromonas sp. MMG006 TaxID=2822683 RepID=UPI001B369C24|nr:AraC family transcriptional regulator [Pseudoalteromonas sp. MMG006]MBQ4798763.1 helix-turn-helix domain-containing protein [Pseudoalteromonas sp. MMG006]
MNKLSIRYYSQDIKRHQHNYHQLVLPLHCEIHITLNDEFKTTVSTGSCIVIEQNVVHAFTADEAARFIVADLDALPDNLINLFCPKISIDNRLLSYLQFIEQQMLVVSDDALTHSTFDLFYLLLCEQVNHSNIDKRIDTVITTVKQNLAYPYTLKELADIACLSVTQFKTVFKKSTTMSALQYLTMLRIQHARALLIHSDLPIALVGERIGYNDASAFSRRFNLYFGQPPKAFAKL